VNEEREDIVEVVRDETLSSVLPTLPDTNVEALIKMAEDAPRMVEAYKKMRHACIKLMNPKDWVDQDGKPYPQSSGLEKVADALGFSWGFLKSPEKIDLGDKYIYSTMLWISSPYRRIQIEGMRSSDDPLYAGTGGGDLKPMAEVDEADIRKASYTNALARGLSIIMGLRNMTWDELALHGISKENATSIKRYKQPEATESEQNKVNSVREMLTELSNGDPKAALKLLEEVTSFKGKDGTMVPGVKGFSSLRDKRLDVTYSKVLDMKRAQEKAVEESGDGEEE